MAAVFRPRVPVTGRPEPPGLLAGPGAPGQGGEEAQRHHGQAGDLPLDEEKASGQDGAGGQEADDDSGEASRLRADISWDSANWTVAGNKAEEVLGDRYNDSGLEGLTDRSRRPYRHANQLPFQIEKLIVRLRQDKPTWGAPKIRERLARLYPDVHRPAIST